MLIYSLREYVIIIQKHRKVYGKITEISRMMLL